MKKVIMYGVLLMALGLFAHPAAATLTLYLEQGASSITVVDGSGNPLDGSVSVSQGTVLGNFTIQSATGIGVPATAPGQLLDLVSLSVSSASGGTLTLRLADIDFNIVGNLLATIGGTVANGIGTGTLSYNLYRDTDNAFTINNVGTLGSIICSGGPFGDGAFADTKNCLSNSAGPYALTLEVIISHVGAASTSFDYSIDGKVPEPASMLLFGFGLVGLGVWGRKRLSK